MAEGRLNLTAEQRAAVFDRRHELAVSAAAGSGKTTVLTERVVQGALGLDDQGNYQPGLELDLSRLLVVTFTNAAANTLRERLGQRLLEEIKAALAEQDEGRSSGPEQGSRLSRLRRQLANLARAQVSTIHSFCSDVVRRYGHTCGVSLGRLMDDDEARQVRHDLATSLLDEALGAGADEQLRALALAWGGTDGLGPEDLEQVVYESGLRRILLALSSFRSVLVDPGRWAAQTLGQPPLDPEAYDPAHPAVAEFAEDCHNWLTSLRETCLTELTQTEAALSDSVHSAYLDCRLQILTRLDGDRLSWDEMRQLLADLLERQPELKYKRAALSTDTRDLRKAAPEVADRMALSTKQLKAEAEDWAKALADDWAVVARRENKVSRWLERLWRLAEEFDRAYASFKRQHGLADFSDQERLALDVLCAGFDESGRPLPSDAARELRGHFQAVLVDEYQDVNPLQHALINLVVADPPTEGAQGRSFFAVGDLKQSIYAFRHAEPALFADLQAELSAAGQPDSQAEVRHGRVCQLQANFRSRRTLIAAINQVFTGLMNLELGGEEYGPGTELIYGGVYDESAEASGDLPACLSLVLRDPAGDSEVAEAEETLDELAFQRVAQVLHQARAEEGRDGARRFRWRDMVVLVRATAQIDPMRQILEEAGVPAYAPGTTGFYERPEIADALSVLAVIDNPRRDIPLAAVLRGPLGGLSPAELLRSARPETLEGWERQPLWQRLRACLDGDALQPGLRAKLQRCIQQLEGWRAAATYLPLPELIWRIYTDGGLLAAAAALAGGRQRVANLIELHSSALRFEQQGMSSLVRFMEQVRLSRAAASDAGEAPVLTEAQDVVQIMTVHKSKGLEFPVVVLPYLWRQFNFHSSQGDVLMHPQAGLAGLHFDLAQEINEPGEPDSELKMPIRQPTLAYRRTRAAIRRDLRSEELRLLYVAMTRARERLELVMPLEIEEQSNGQETMRSLKDRGAAASSLEAKRPWDWIKRQLGGDITHALSEHGITLESEAPGPVSDDWRVVVVPESRLRDTREKPETADPAESNGSATPDWDSVRERLRWQYGASGEAQLPAKLTVTRVARQAAMELDETGLLLTGDEAPREQLPVDAAALGTLVHKALARLSFGPQVDEVLVRNALSELQAPPELAEHVPVSDLLAMLRDLHQSFDGFSGAVLRKEVPVSMLVSPAELPSGLWPGDPGDLWADSQVLVQGSIDLLAVWDDRALVLDYKLSRAPADLLLQRYGAQLAWYAAAVRALLPGFTPERVQWALYGIGGAGLVLPGTRQL